MSFVPVAALAFYVAAFISYGWAVKFFFRPPSDGAGLPKEMKILSAFGLATFLIQASLMLHNLPTLQGEVALASVGLALIASGLVLFWLTIRTLKDNHFGI